MEKSHCLNKKEITMIDPLSQKWRLVIFPSLIDIFLIGRNTLAMKQYSEKLTVKYLR